MVVHPRDQPPSSQSASRSSLSARPLSRETDEFHTPNGGRMVDAMHILDGYIGEVLAEIEELGIAENTLVLGVEGAGN